MKRKFLSISLILVILVSMTSALAAPRRASDYLAGYGISIEAQGNGLMEVFYDVDGTGWMTRPSNILLPVLRLSTVTRVANGSMKS